MSENKGKLIAQKLIRNAAYIKLTDTADSVHFWGGTPTVENAIPWPICQNCNSSQTFLAQVDMSKLPFTMEISPPVLCFYVCLQCVGNSNKPNFGGEVGLGVLLVG